MVFDVARFGVLLSEVRLVLVHLSSCRSPFIRATRVDKCSACGMEGLEGDLACEALPGKEVERVWIIRAGVT
jgi:hypothetical protein